MVHSGYEASAVNDTFGSIRGLLATARATLFSRYRSQEALRTLAEPVKPLFQHQLVQLETNATTPVEERV
jgi:hypothetical protein